MSDQHVGPIDYLVMEFSEAKITGEGMAILLDLVDRGVIRILDLRFVVAAADGSFTAVEVADLDGDGELDLAVFEGVQSGLLDDDDVAQAASLIAPGSAAGLLVYENTWAGPFVTAMRNAGGEVLASGRLPATDVIAALEALESAEAETEEREDTTMGLIGGMARTAVVAGTATAVSNRVSRRQAGRWASQDEQAYAEQQPQYAAPPPQYAAPAPTAPDTDDALDQLQKLGELRAAGVLTEEEFAAQKAKILAG